MARCSAALAGVAGTGAIGAAGCSGAAGAGRETRSHTMSAAPYTPPTTFIQRASGNAPTGKIRQTPATICTARSIQPRSRNE